MKHLLFALLASCCFLFTNFAKAPNTYSYALDTEQSVVEWSGASPRTSHQGAFSIRSQGLEVVDGKILGGSFTMPIASIRNFDLPKTIQPVLIKHLKSKDFFNMALYPEAEFTLTTVSPLAQAPQAAVTGANVQVKGNFRLLGVTHPLSFPARVQVEGESLFVEALFTIDRTRWGMTHAADPSLKNRHIYPEVDIHLKLVAQKN